jgi:hypothetical protein
MMLAPKGVSVMSKTQSVAPESQEACLRIFEGGFGEFLHFTRYFTQRQKDNLFDSLPHQERLAIKKSRDEGGWLDVVVRSKIGNFIDQIQEKYSINLIQMRCSVLRGKSIYLARELWETVMMETEGYLPEHKRFVVGDIKGVVCKSNADVVLLVRENSQTEE